MFAAHPRNRGQNALQPLAKDRDAFFEQVMGSSHLINSTGSLWGLEREGDTTVFVGGRQRANGQMLRSKPPKPAGRASLSLVG